MTGFLVYSFIFPFALHKYGLSKALTWGLVIQVILSFIVIYACDRSARDVFQLQDVKANFCRQFPFLIDESARTVWGRLRMFLIFVWKCTPPMVLLLMRIGGEKGHPVREILLVFGAIMGATIYSVGLELIVVNGGRWALGFIALLIAWPLVKKVWSKIIGRKAT